MCVCWLVSKSMTAWQKKKILCEYKTLIKTGGKIINCIYYFIADLIKVVRMQRK